MFYGIWIRIKPKEKYVQISMKEIWRNLDGPPKNKELWCYVVSFEFSRPKVAEIVPSLMSRVMFLSLSSVTVDNGLTHRDLRAAAKRNNLNVPPQAAARYTH